jgi:hypothetical protein
VEGNRAAAKAAPCKILLRITANLTTRVCPAKSAPQRVATGTNIAFLFSARAGRPSHGWAVFPNDSGAYRVPAPPPVFGTEMTERIRL